MKITHDTTPIEVGGAQEKGSFSLNSEGVSVFAALAVSLYTRKLFAFIRETAQNGSDETDEPLLIHMPTTYEPYLSIRDYGPGLSHDDMMKLYTCVGMSTKADDDEKTGGFGVGSKAAFAYSDTFTVVSYHGGEVRTYICNFDQANLPTISLVNIRVLVDDERTGLDVQCPVQPHDYGQARAEVEEACSRFPVLPFLTQGAIPPMKYGTKRETWGIRDASMRGEDRYGRRPAEWKKGPRAVVGRMHYPLDLAAVVAKSTDPAAKELHELWKRDTDLDLFLPIGTVDVALSREGLAYTDHTVNNIVAAFKVVDEDVATMARTEFKGVKTLWDFSVRYRKLHASMHNQGQVWAMLKRGAKVLREKFGKEYNITNPAGGFFPGDAISDIGINSLLDNSAFRFAFKAKRDNCTVDSLKAKVRTVGEDDKEFFSLPFPFDIHEWQGDDIYAGYLNGVHGTKARERKRYTLSPQEEYAVVVINKDDKPTRYFDRLEHHFGEYFGNSNWTVCVIHHKYDGGDPSITLEDILAYVGFGKDVPVIAWEDMLAAPPIVRDYSDGNGTVRGNVSRAMKVQKFNFNYTWSGWDKTKAPFSRMTHVVNQTLADGERNFYFPLSRGQPLRDDKDTKFQHTVAFCREMEHLWDTVVPRKDPNGEPTVIYGISKSLVKSLEGLDNWINIGDLAREHYAEEAKMNMVPLKHSSIWAEWTEWKLHNYREELPVIAYMMVNQMCSGMDFLTDDGDFHMDNLFGKVVADYGKLRTAYIGYNHLQRQCDFWGVGVDLSDTPAETCTVLKNTLFNAQWLEPYTLLHALMRRGSWAMSSDEKVLERAEIKHYIEMVDKERTSKP